MADLGIIDAETVAAITSLDLSTVAPASSDDSGLWITNDSDYRAEDVIVAASGTDGGQLWLSLDGNTFTASINVGDIAPGGASLPFWLRRVTPSTAAPGVFSGSVTVTPTSWSLPVDNSTSDNVPLS